MPGKQYGKPRMTRREKKAQTSALVKTANEATDLMSNLTEWTSFKKNGLNLKIEYASSNDLNSAEMELVFDLLKRNMKLIYEKSDWGWNDSQKKEELTDKNARFLLIKDNEKIVGFSHFRFDIEVNYPILYCYELQIDYTVQRKGVGRYIMNILFLLAHRFKLVKVLLTVFKHNEAGLNFYMKSLSFRHDETCPKDEEEKCYVILSKVVDKYAIINIQCS